MSIAEEQHYQRKINFFKHRLETCGYRFHDLIQTRRKEIPRLAAEPKSESLGLEVEAKVLARTDTFINCLRGEHYSNEIPEYLSQEANAFKNLVYGRLAPRYVLEEERFKLLEKIFAEGGK